MSYPPQGPYPPQSEPPYGQSWPPYQPPIVEQEKAGLFRAGKYGIWFLIAVIGTPIVLVLGCCAACWGMGLLGSVLPTPDPSTTP